MAIPLVKGLAKKGNGPFFIGSLGLKKCRNQISEKRHPGFRARLTFEPSGKALKRAQERMKGTEDRAFHTADLGIGRDVVKGCAMAHGIAQEKSLEAKIPGVLIQGKGRVDGGMGFPFAPVFDIPPPTNAGITNPSLEESDIRDFKPKSSLKGLDFEEIQNLAGRKP